MRDLRRRCGSRLGRIVFWIVLGAAPVAALATEPADLVGLWTRQGVTVQFRAVDGGEIVGSLVELSDAARAIGYREGDVVITRVRVAGTRVEFVTLLRPDSPELAPHCPPQEVAFTGTIAADGTSIEGTIGNGGFEAARGEDGRIVVCRYVARSGTLAIRYDRVTRPPTAVVATLTTLPDDQDVYPLGASIIARVTVSSAQPATETVSPALQLRLYREVEPAAANEPFLSESRVPEEVVAPGGGDLSDPLIGTHDVRVELPDRVGYWRLRLSIEPEGGSLLAEKRLETVPHVVPPRALSVAPPECSAGETISVRLELPDAENFGAPNPDGIVVALLREEEPRFTNALIVEYVQIPHARIAGAHDLTYACPGPAGRYEIAVFDRFIDPRYVVARHALLATRPVDLTADATGDGVTLSCTDVGALREAVRKLDDAVATATITHGTLPTAPMFELPITDRLTAQVEAPRRRRVAEVIRNQGADDFLRRQLDDDSVAGRFRKLVMALVEGPRPCDREQWRTTLRDLRSAREHLERELRGVERLVEGTQSEAAYHRRWMAPLFRRPWIDSAPLPALLESLGVPHAHGVAVGATLTHLGVDTYHWGRWRFFTQPFHMGGAHFALGALSAIDSTVTAIFATTDLLQLNDARLARPPFLQALEQSAYLEPLLLNYRAISDAMGEVIVEVSRLNRRAP